MIASAIFDSRIWYKFSRNKLSVVGLVLVLMFVGIAILAPLIVPYPEHAGAFVDFRNRSQPPSWNNWFGTDLVGRDILSRIFYGARISLVIAVTVVVISGVIGVGLGAISGYFAGITDF